MFCKHCGKEVNDNAIICPNCGVATDNYGKTPVNTESTPADNNNADKKFNGLALAGMICAIAGIIGGNYILCIPSVVGLILSIFGIVKARQINSGHGFALAGIIVGAIGLFIWSIVWIYLGAIWFNIIFVW